MTVLESTQVSIYALVDPRSGMARYVGKAVDPQARLRQHLQPAQLSRYRTKKNSWIKSLQSDGLAPEMVVLQQVAPEDANKADRKNMGTCRWSNQGEAESTPQAWGS